MTADAAPAEHAARLGARADQVVLCLDFDGTLSRSSPTRRRPGCCLAWSSCSGAGRRHAAVALISGRP